MQSYHLTVELLQLVCLFRGTFDGLQGTFHSVQPVLAVRLLEHNLTENLRRQHFNDEFAEPRKKRHERIHHDKEKKKNKLQNTCERMVAIVYLPSTFE